jgi:hypothetical protein
MQNEEQYSDARILAEFERLVLQGHRREIAERLVANAYGRTRPAIHALVMGSKIKKPKKAEAKGEAETVSELATEAFNAEGIWEPDEGQYNLLLEALENAHNAGTPITIDFASEILKAILAGGSHGMCCNFVVKPKAGVDDQKFSSSQRTDRE